MSSSIYTNDDNTSFLSRHSTTVQDSLISNTDFYSPSILAPFPKFAASQFPNDQHTTYRYVHPTQFNYYRKFQLSPQVQLLVDMCKQHKDILENMPAHEGNPNLPNMNLILENLNHYLERKFTQADPKEDFMAELSLTADYLSKFYGNAFCKLLCHYIASFISSRNYGFKNLVPVVFVAFISAFSRVYLLVPSCKNACFSLLTDLVDENFNLKLNSQPWDVRLFPAIFAALSNFYDEGDHEIVNEGEISKSETAAKIICSFASYINNSIFNENAHPFGRLGILELSRIFYGISRCFKDDNCKKIAFILGKNLYKAIQNGNLNKLRGAELSRLLDASSKFQGKEYQEIHFFVVNYLFNDIRKGGFHWRDLTPDCCTRFLNSLSEFPADKRCQIVISLLTGYVKRNFNLSLLYINEFIKIVHALSKFSKIINCRELFLYCLILLLITVNFHWLH